LEKDYREIRSETSISENQFGFTPRKSTMELRMVFIDLEKTYDRAPREVIKWALMEKRGTKNAYKFDSQYV